MANVFMPSAFTTMNAASRGTLEDIVKQRIVEAKLAEMQHEQQRQLAMDAFNVQLRSRADARDGEALRLRNRQFDADVLETQTKAERDARDTATTAGLRSLFNEGLSRGADPVGLTQIAVESGGKIPLGAIPKPEPAKPTREERDADIKADIFARRAAEADADKQWPTPTKASKAKEVKDSPALPRGVKAALDAKRGQPRWEDKEAAAAQVYANWDALRKDHPGLSLSAVMGYLEDLYGGQMTVSKAEKAVNPSAGGIDKSALRKRVEARFAAK